MNSLNILKEHLEILIGVSCIIWPVTFLIMNLAQAAYNIEHKETKDRFTDPEKYVRLLLFSMCLEIITCGIIILYYSQH